MPRTTPPDRLEKLIEVAAKSFVNHGFQRTQMDEVALDLGVSKGTVYRSVESKEALLAAVLVYGDDVALLRQTASLETASFAALSNQLSDQLATAMSGLKLAAALRLDAPQADHDAQDLALDAYQMLRAHRVRIMVLDRCAPEVPALGGEWYEAGRYALVDLWLQYLNRAADRTHPTETATTTVAGNQMRASSQPANNEPANNEPASNESSIKQPSNNDLANTLPASLATTTIESLDVTARTIVEILALWAVKMPWDPQPRSYSPHTPTIVASIVSSLVETALARSQTAHPDTARQATKTTASRKKP